MNGNFCNNMYEFIYSKARQDRVLLANSLVTGHFKEPLRKNGSCDTDGDTLSDSDEIDWGEIKINSDGSYHFPTWGELIDKSDYKYSTVSPLYQSLKDLTVIPALSNPFSKDSDNDYYPDDIDKDKMEANPMYIYDKGLDDSYFHKGEPVPKEMITDKYSDGDFDSDYDFEKNEYYARYSFKRAKRGIYKFTLTPKRLSYYKLTSSGSSRISSVYKTILGESVEIVPEGDGTYLLDIFTEYTIMLFVFDNANNIEFTIEQDNWYKAENGGKQEAIFGGTYSDILELERMYIPQNFLLEALKDVSGDAFYTAEDWNDKDVAGQTKIIMEKLKLSDDLEDMINSTLSSALTIMGSSAIVDALKSNKPKNKLVIGIAILKDLGNLYLLYVTIDDGYFGYFEAVDFKNAAEKGNLNVIYTKAEYRSTAKDLWDPWLTPGYIYKIYIDPMQITAHPAKITKNESAQDVVKYWAFE